MRQAGGATFKRKHVNSYISVQQRDDEFQPKISFHQNKPVKNSQKEKELVLCLMSIFFSSLWLDFKDEVSIVRTSLVTILTWSGRLSSKVAQDMGVEIL